MSEDKSTRVFQMDADTALRFFELVEVLVKRGFEDTIELRTELLNYLAETGHMDRVYDTRRDKEQIIKDFRKQGFRVHEPCKNEYQCASCDRACNAADPGAFSTDGIYLCGKCCDLINEDIWDD